MKPEGFIYFFALLLCLNIKSASTTHSSDTKIADIAINYFQLKSIKVGLVLVCGTKQELVCISKKIAKETSSLMRNLNSDTFQNTKSMKSFFETYLKQTSTFNSVIIVDLNCNNSERVLQMAAEADLFDYIHKWLMIGTNFEEKLSILRQIPFRLDSNVWLAINKKSKYLWKIYDIYTPGRKLNSKQNITFNGFWISDEKKHMPYNFSNYINNEDSVNFTVNNIRINEGNWRLYSKKFELRDRRNLFGLKIDMVSAITNKPPRGGFLKYLSTPKNVHLDSMHRYGYAIMFILKDVFNFRMNIFRTNNWGIVINGTWTGVIGALYYGRAEIAITPTQFKVERLDFIDVGPIIWLARPCIIFKHPKDVGLRNNFLQPLALNVWWATAILLIIVAIVLKIISTQSVRISYMLNKKREALEEKQDSAWSNILMITIIGGICQQGFSYVPNMYSGRTMTTIILIFSFMLFQFYSASIVSSLLMEPPHTINNLEDITNSKLEVLIEDIPYNYDFFDSTTDPTAIKLYKKKILHQEPKKVYLSPIPGLELVRKGGYAFQVDIATAYKIIPETFDERSICDLVEIQLFPPKPLTTVVRERSPYHQMVSYGLCRIQEHGLMKYHKSHWHYPKPKCTLSGTSQTESVTIAEMATAFMLLLICCVLSLIILSIEINIKKHKMNKT